ncbi:MAG: reverse gyrase [Thermodesulfovibrio sp.]
MISSVFKNLCPNCGSDITYQRLQNGLLCENCLPKENVNPCDYIEFGNFKHYCNIQEEKEKWEKHFEKHIHSKPWSLQTAWAKRVFSGSSFALLAPTGVGKTSFGICTATYFAEKGKKSYIILPTKLLVEQVSFRLKNFVSEDYVLTFNEDGAKTKKINKERLIKGDFRILVTTSMFLYKNFQIIPKDFDFIFVDDVDSFLKTAKNIDKVLYLLGFSEEDVKKAMQLIFFKVKDKKIETDWQKINELQKQIDEIKNKCKGVLVVSSATSSPRSSRVKLFRELLGFEVGTPTFYMRNVVDAYTYEEDLIYWIKKLGKGGLVFLSSDKGKDYVEEVVERLNQNGIKAISYEEIDENTLKSYENGKIDVLVGIASYKNPLARGFDMPHVVRYSIFYGVPKIVVSLNFESNLNHLMWGISSIRSFIVKKFPQYKEKINKWLEQLKKYQYLNEQIIQKSQIRQKIDTLRSEIGNFLTSEEILNLLKSSEELTLKVTDEGYFLVVSDATGYLQASGRVSRMYAGGITKGLSLILIDDKSAFNHLMKKIRWFTEDINFISAKELDLNSLLREIDYDREKIKNFLVTKKSAETKDLLKPVLIVVESPNKAKTIANFFGKPIRRKIMEHDVYETSTQDRYIIITSSFGHIVDLTKREAFYGVNVNQDIVPIYEPIEGKDSIINSLRKIALEVDQVLVATDPDTEGEKIGWDIYGIMKPYVKDIKRMEFHEVTKRAIKNALETPRDFDLNLVKAQIIRRVSDRWVGFEFSQLLHKTFGKYTLSAGRVQTPVLGWIIERERQNRQKIYKIIVTIHKEEKKLKFSFDFEDKNEAIQFLNSLSEVTLEVINKTERVENPPPPYRTDTMLKDAFDRYGFSLYRTMELAQTLFELGFITYHRTDSQRVSDIGLTLAREFITEEFGQNYFSPKQWADKGAHECIRPTKAIEPEELSSMVMSGQIDGLTKQHLLLYELIFNRFIASQMKPIKAIFSQIKIKALDKQQIVDLRTKIIEDGWNRILKVDIYPETDGVFNVTESKEIRQQPKQPLYTHGEIVWEMKQKGIGRPSTYATIVEKLVERGYVREVKGFLIPTELGKKVYSYLKSREELENFLSEDFTRQLETLMDKVEEGSVDYKSILYELYNEILKTRTH